MLEDIHVFCAIAKHQSFAKAARDLSLSTPVVTRRLARLEESLNARLLNRTTRQVTLTEAGNLFYMEVNDILQALEASKECVKSLTTKITGSLKVALPLTFAQTNVLPAIKKFLSQYPNLTIQISSGVNQLHLLNEGYDLVIHCGPLPNSSFHYKKLGQMKKIICASPEYFQKFGIPKTIDELQHHNCLGFGDTQPVWEFVVDGQKKEIPVHGNVQVNSGIDLKLLALEGVGISYLAHYLVTEELKSGKLISILNQHQLLNHDMYAVFPTHKYLSKKTQLFLNFVQELLTEVFI